MLPPVLPVLDVDVVACCSAPLYLFDANVIGLSSIPAFLSTCAFCSIADGKKSIFHFPASANNCSSVYSAQCFVMRYFVSPLMA